jgi:hypothetical protein
MVDFLDECVDLEEHHFQDGYDEGFRYVLKYYFPV